MEVIIPGRKYNLSTAKGFPAVSITFCSKDEEGIFIDGITNEELVNLLEHRLAFLVSQRPTTENMNALTHLKQTKQWLHARNYKKLKRSKSSENNNNDHSGNGIHLQTKGGQAGQQSRS